MYTSYYGKLQIKDNAYSMAPPFIERPIDRTSIRWECSLDNKLEVLSLENSNIQLSMYYKNIFKINLLHLNQIIWYENSFKSSLRDDSNEWSHHMVWMSNN